MRIGVFGGSFDPVHTGHLAAAAGVAAALDLDEVRFVPAAQQPFKTSHRASGGDRAAMLDLAVAGTPRFVVDRRELTRSGPSYSVDTLDSLRRDFPRDRLFLMVGADAARDLATWRQAERLPALADIVIHSRPGLPVPALPWPATVVEVPTPNIAATDVRQAVAAGASIANVVPEAVATFIRAHRLYRTEDSC